MASKADFKIGEQVHHFKFGAGKVLGFSQMEDGSKTIEVEFENSGKKLLSLAHVMLEKVNDDALQAKKTKHHNWPENTFFNEPADQPHYLGSHWDAFCDDKEILKALPDYLGKAIPANGYGGFFKSPLAGRDNAKTFFQLNTPNQEMGLSAVLEVTPENNVIKTLFPFCTKGKQNGVIIERVHVWDGNCEAQIEGRWGDTTICFFDTRFIHDRAWYVAKEMYEFILTGIAYAAMPTELQLLKIPHAPKVIQKLIEEGVIEHADDFSDEVDMSQGAIFFPIAEWDRDDYNFQGKIKELNTFDDFLGQSGWIATVTVMKTLSDNLDLDLKIVITQKVWQAETPPEVDTYIRGTLWLQGHLWNVTNKQHF